MPTPIIAWWFESDLTVHTVDSYCLVCWPLSSNSLEGFISTEIAFVEELRGCFASGSFLVGSILTEVGQLFRLSFVVLGSYMLSGSLQIEAWWVWSFGISWVEEQLTLVSIVSSYPKCWSCWDWDWLWRDWMWLRWNAGNVFHSAKILMPLGLI